VAGSRGDGLTDDCKVEGASKEAPGVIVKSPAGCKILN
jgi:hypothetical protein